MSARLRTAAITILLVIGLGLLGTGLNDAIVAPRRGDRAAAELAGLRTLTLVNELAGLPEGQRVIFAGWMAAPPGTPPGGAATCVIRPAGRGRWHTPAFVLRQPDGTVRVVNDDYRVVETYATAPRGFCVDDVAYVDGAVVQGPDGPALRASAVFAGDRSDYVTALGGDPAERWPSDVFGWVRVGLGVPPLLAALVWIALARRGGRCRDGRIT